MKVFVFWYYNFALFYFSIGNFPSCFEQSRDSLQSLLFNFYVRNQIYSWHHRTFPRCETFRRGMKLRKRIELKQSSFRRSRYIWTCINKQNLLRTWTITRMSDIWQYDDHLTRFIISIQGPYHNSKQPPCPAKFFRHPVVCNLLFPICGGQAWGKTTELLALALTAPDGIDRVPEKSGAFFLFVIII